MTDLDLGGDPPSAAADGVWLACIECGATFAPFDDVRYTCDDCDGLLEARYADYPTFDDFDGRGVWRYAAALPFAEGVTLPEGDTPLHYVPRLREEVGVEALRVKHEGMNPTGSFKDRGMTVGVRVAQELGVGRLACASTGNTSAALAAYGARAGMETLVLLPTGKVAAGKVAQASLHGARILEVDGNFDACLDIVQDLAARGEAYLLNSLNPFRLEGQKTIGFEILERFFADEGRYPDRIVLPVGNAGNTAALYKAFRELVASGALDGAGEAPGPGSDRAPRVGVVALLGDVHCAGRVGCTDAPGPRRAIRHRVRLDGAVMDRRQPVAPAEDLFDGPPVCAYATRGVRGAVGCDAELFVVAHPAGRQVDPRIGVDSVVAVEVEAQEDRNGPRRTVRKVQEQVQRRTIIRPGQIYPHLFARRLPRERGGFSGAYLP